MQGAKHGQSARAFLTFLRSSEAKAAMSKSGLLPG